MEEIRKAGKIKPFDVIDVLIMILFILIMAYPLWFIVVGAFNEGKDYMRGGVYLWPRVWTLDNFKAVFRDKSILNSFAVTIAKCAVGTVTSVLFTCLVSYGLCRPNLKFKKVYIPFIMFTMFFGGGLMPTYLLMDQLKLINTVWAVLLPGALNVWNLILARSYYRSIPGELREAAEVDGADDVQYFFRVLLPVCTPIISVLCLYQFVAQWNSYFDAMIYLDDQAMQPLQLVIRAILVQNQINPNLIANMEKLAETAKLADLLKYSTIVISSVPLVIMYPFFSKYFEKGIMVGSVKG